MIHVYTYACIWAKTGEYLAFFLAFVDVDSICWTNDAYTCKYYLPTIESTNLHK
jgi:hypothetical protein